MNYVKVNNSGRQNVWNAPRYDSRLRTEQNHVHNTTSQSPVQWNQAVKLNYIYFYVHLQRISCIACLFLPNHVSSSGLSPDLQSMEQIRRIMRPTDVPDTGLLSYSMCLCHWTKKRPNLGG